MSDLKVKELARRLDVLEEQMQALHARPPEAPPPGIIGISRDVPPEAPPEIAPPPEKPEPPRLVSHKPKRKEHAS